LELIPWGAIGALTPSGIVTAFVLMLMWGKIVPKSQLEREQQLADKWEAAAVKEREANAAKDHIIEKLTATNGLLSAGVGETVAKVMTELQKKASDDE